MKLTLNNGVTMPALGLGVFQSTPEQTTAAVEAALAAGYWHIDTAAAYGNEPPGCCRIPVRTSPERFASGSRIEDIAAITPSG